MSLPWSTDKQTVGQIHLMEFYSTTLRERRVNIYTLWAFQSLYKSQDCIITLYAQNLQNGFYLWLKSGLET